MSHFFCNPIKAAILVFLSLVAIARGETGKDRETVYISDEPELVQSSTQGWGKLGLNVAADGSPLRIGDQRFDKGLGTHAEGVMVLAVDGLFESFDAEVGLHPCPGGQVIFRVVVDGRTAFDSGV